MTDMTYEALRQFTEAQTVTGGTAKTWTFTPAPKPLGHWADRFRSRQGRFADAYLAVGPVSFHLTLMPSEGWAYRVTWRGVDMTVRW